MAKIRFYKYFFKGEKKPIVMEAYDRFKADKMLEELIYRSNGKININALEDIRLETPIIGISTKKNKDGQVMVWIGTDLSRDGWTTKIEFDKIQNLKL